MIDIALLSGGSFLHVHACLRVEMFDCGLASCKQTNHMLAIHYHYGFDYNTNISFSFEYSLKYLSGNSYANLAINSDKKVQG